MEFLLQNILHTLKRKKGADLTNFGQEKKGADLTNSQYSRTDCELYLDECETLLSSLIFNNDFMILIAL